MDTSPFEKELMKLPPLLALSGMLEDQLGENCVFDKKQLNHEQYVILYHLFLAEEPIRMKDVARILLKSPSTATIQTEVMVHEGLVRRFPSEKDRRVLYISITPKGKKLLAEIQQEVLSFMKNICSEISEEELRITISTLLKFINKSKELLNINLDDFLSIIER